MSIVNQQTTRISFPRTRSRRLPLVDRGRSCRRNNAGRATRTHLPCRCTIQPTFQRGYLRPLPWRSDAQHGQPGAFRFRPRPSAPGGPFLRHRREHRQCAQQSNTNVDHQRPCEPGGDVRSPDLGLLLHPTLVLDPSHPSVPSIFAVPRAFFANQFKIPTLWASRTLRRTSTTTARRHSATPSLITSGSSTSQRRRTRLVRRLWAGRSR